MPSKEWAVFNALSTKYAFKLDFGLGDGVSKNATISRITLEVEKQKKLPRSRFW
jgi:hypothetical protein